MALAVEGEHFDSALERVEECFWLWFRWPDGKENAGRRVVRNVVKKSIPQMFYEGRIESVITYYNRVLGRKIKRAEACQTDLTKEEYMQENVKKRPVSDVEAYASARMGDQEGSFCNPKAAANIEAYTQAAKELLGPEFDVMNAPIDKLAVYRAGRGKKHGRYLIGDGLINTASTLSEVRASSVGSQNEIHSQRCQQTYPCDRLSEQEIEARKILEEKLNDQIEITNCLKEGYAALAMIIQTQLNIPIPPLVLPSQNGSSYQGTSGGLGVGPAETGAATATEAGEGEVAANGGHKDESMSIN